MHDPQERMAEDEGRAPEVPSDTKADTGETVAQEHWTALHGRSIPWPMGWGEKLLLSFLTLSLIAVFVILAIRTEPDPRGLGTHEQLGLEPCGFLQVRGYPCPTCGCTTAASLLVHARPVDAFQAQPFGALLALAAMGFVLASLWHLYQGRSLFARLAFWPWFRIFALGAGVLLGSWYYIVQTWQQHH